MNHMSSVVSLIMWGIFDMYVCMYVLIHVSLYFISDPVQQLTLEIT